MTTNELTKIWGKISGLFARKTELTNKADKAAIARLYPDVNQRIVSDKTFAEVLNLLNGGTAVWFDYQGTTLGVEMYSSSSIYATAIDNSSTLSLNGCETMISSLGSLTCKKN